MKGQGMLRATRRQRTIARAAEVRGVGFFHGADVTARFLRPSPSRDRVPAGRSARPAHDPRRVDSVVPSQRRTTIRRGAASVEMIEHVMAALAGLQIDNAWSRSTPASAPAATARAGPSSKPSIGPGPSSRTRSARPSWSRSRSASARGMPYSRSIPRLVRRPDALLPPRLRPGVAVRAQSFCLGLSADSFRTELASSRTFLLETEARRSRRRDRGPDHRGRPLALRPRRRRRQRAALPRRVRAAQGPGPSRGPGPDRPRPSRVRGGVPFGASDQPSLVRRLLQRAARGGRWRRAASPEETARSTSRES